MEIRKWKLEQHPTCKPIPLGICPFNENRPDFKDYVPLLKDSGYYKNAQKLIDEHNSLVIEHVKLLDERERE